MFRRLIDINLTGAFLIAQACARQMIAQKTGGSIILIASMSGSIVNYPQEQSCYNASKAAVIQLGKSLAAEWAQHGIRVNTISPGYMDTALNRVPALEAQKKIWMSMTPMQRLGKVDELNGLAVFLASEASSLVTGADYIADVSTGHGGTLLVLARALADFGRGVIRFTSFLGDFFREPVFFFSFSSLFPFFARFSLFFLTGGRGWLWMGIGDWAGMVLGWFRMQVTDGFLF